MIDPYRYDLAHGLPAIANFPECFDKARDWLIACDPSRVVAHIEADSPTVTLHDETVPPGWLALQFVQRDGRLELFGMVYEPDEWPTDVIAAGLFLLAVAAATGRPAGRLDIYCALGEELPTEPLTPVRV